MFEMREECLWLAGIVCGMSVFIVSSTFPHIPEAAH